MKKTIFLLVLSVMFFALTSCEKILETAVKNQMNQTRTDMLTDDNLHVVLVGSGGPLPNNKRVSVCTAVIAGGEFILVDTGPGTARNMMLQNLPIGSLSAVFLTHFHSDHIGDLGEVNMFSWIQGNRKHRLEVFGPEGVEKVVKGYALAYEQDSHYRTAHHGEDVAPAGGAKPVAKIIPRQDTDQAKLFYDKNGLKAYAFEVDHFPARPAVGYRFEYKGNVVVITGDTKKTDTLAKHADKADLFICDALDAKAIDLAAKVASKINQPAMAKILTDIPDYHLTPVQAAQTAHEARVKKLVFYHIVPPITNVILKRRYLEGVSDEYDGDVEVGEDGMTFEFEPKQY
jgi:ribonuclease Z